MGVDETGHHHPPVRVEHVFIRVAAAELVRRAGDNDQPIADKHGTVRDNAQAAQVGSTLGTAGEGK